MKQIFFLFLSLYLTLHLDAYGRCFLIDSIYPNHKIEVLIESPPTPSDHLLIFLHGAKDQGLKSIQHSYFEYWLNKRYAIAAISLPGYGKSTGRKDFCGPFTLTSLNFAIENIKKTLNISDFGILGFGQGGLAGILLTTQRDDICCLVCSNSGFDLFRHRDAGDPLTQTIREKDYDFDLDDDEALIYRSPIRHVSAINAPIFILHRKGNPVISDDEVIDFYRTMQEAEKECSLIIKDKSPADDVQKISYRELLEETGDWIDSHMIFDRSFSSH